ncbi:hypothetical protein [Dyadobacter pollutisoli]|jgi:hypothetical protein|uniref:Uncharacterized protein n=1 Tax=Dyadobacter pollutisoli TaxID=2910158 RepID=A0A9E8SMS1_9BACT|nr:hypothetical protein [Dyadobacter pollutisoli]WAC13051.1 hypothetical protein ON006_03615 [Dyadobacter pollutisoli]
MEDTEDSIGKRIWLWGLPALILTGLGLLIYFHNFAPSGTQNSQEQMEIDLLERKENDAKITTYLDFVAQGAEQMKDDHQYYGKALLKLMEATMAASVFAEFNLGDRLSLVPIHANRVSDNPLEATHADDIRAAADRLSEALLEIQMAKYPSLSLEAEAVKEVAERINPDGLTLDQKEVIASFFSKAAILLDKIN